MTKPIDWTKPVIDEDGTPWRVLCADRPRSRIYNVLLMQEGTGRLASAAADGTTLETGQSFRNAPVKREGWVNVYPDAVFSSKENADHYASLKNRLACVRIEWEE